MSRDAAIDAMLRQQRGQSFRFHEADLLDRWKLEQWEALFADEALYLVPPTDVDGDFADPDTSLFYIFDDRPRIHERVVRLEKKGAQRISAIENAPPCQQCAGGKGGRYHFGHRFLRRLALERR